MEHVDAVVVGAGVVGLACARALALRGIETIVLERHDTFGSETSSRNSEVIHAGLYYPTDSLKARLCVAGRQQLYAYCADRGISHRRCGKLMVATSPEQVTQLQHYLKQGQANGVTDLAMLTASEAKALEPDLECVAALFSPSTGIVDSHGLMLTLLGDAESAGAMLVVCTPVIGGRIEQDGIVIETGGSEPICVKARIVINAAGLGAPALATSLDGFPSEHVPPCFYAKGNYYALAGRASFSRLVYPMPEPGGLGVHLTLDLAGQARFGPDVEWVSELDYDVDPARADCFYSAVRRYWPGLADGTLMPAYAGIRPKITGPGEAAADFLIQGPTSHGIGGLVNLFGIESPGLTSCLAIAEQVVAPFV